MTKENNQIISKINFIINQFTEILTKNQVIIALVAFLYMLPLFIDAEISPFRSIIIIITEFMIFGIFALSFDLQLGRTGLLNFGQAAFFGIGAYVTAWCLEPVLQAPIGEILNLIPFPITIIIAILSGSLIGLVMGSTTNRMKGTAFAFIALAIAMLILEFMELKGNLEISGGESGLAIEIPSLLTNWIFYILWAIFSFFLILLFCIMIFTDLKGRNSFLYLKLSVRDSALTYNDSKRISRAKTISTFIISILLFLIFLVIFAPNVLSMYLYAEDYKFKVPNQYWLVLTITLLVVFFVKRLIISPFGRVLSAIAQNEDRVKALGYNTFNYKLISVVISGGIAAIAGSLFVTFGSVISTPSTFGVDQTIDVMLFTIMGGMGTLLGPFVGTSLIKFSELRVVEFLNNFNIDGQWWLVFLGLIYILIILFFPYGIVGTVQMKSRTLKRKLNQWFEIKENDYWWITFVFAFVLLVLLLVL